MHAFALGQTVDTHYFYTFLSLSGRSGDLGVEEKSGDNWVKQIRWIRLVELSPGGWRTW
jgi:hypothetical protein